MSLSLPDGATVSLATAYGSPITVTAATNANPPVLSASGHTLVNGDIIEVQSGWNGANNKAFRVSGVAAGVFSLEGLDATDTALFPAGQGIGTVKKISTFTKIDQVLGFDPSGGDGKFVTASLLESDSDINLPAGFNAASILITIGDDPSLPYHLALKTASDKRALRTLRVLFKNGGAIYYVGYTAYDETPSLTKGNVMAVKASFAQQGRPVRYAS